MRPNPMAVSSVDVAYVDEEEGATLVTGVVVNLALDPLLIFVLDLGLVGAGLGTVLGQVASDAFAAA